MDHKDICEFIKENITEDEWRECSEGMLIELMSEYIHAGIDRNLFTKAKMRILMEVLDGMEETLNVSRYRVEPERWVVSIFDVDEGISIRLSCDERFKKKIERTIVFDMTASIRDYLKYRAYGKAA